MKTDRTIAVDASQKTGKLFFPGRNDVLYDAGCLIYPGAYVPLLKEEEVQEELKRPHKGETILPPVNVTELAD